MPAETDPSERRSPWKSGPPPEPRPLRRNLRADVCVVGAGIAGLSVAYHLSRAGRSVIVLERAWPGAGNTGLTTAHLSSLLEERYGRLEELHGPEGARRAYQSHQGAIDEIAATVRAEGITCDFARLDGYLFLGPDDTPDLLDDELDAARRAGFRDVERLPAIPGAPFDGGPCLRFPRQGRFHPLKYLSGLARAVERRGGRIFTGTRVVEIARGRVPAARTGDGFAVHADALVVTTGAPIQDRILVSSKQSAYRTYVVAAPVHRGAVADHLYWDTAEPYHYVRLQPLDRGRDLLIVGGEDHRTGEGPNGDEPWERLGLWARERFPLGRIAHRWSGQVMESVDALGYIGRDPVDRQAVFLATGDSGHGMTHGTLAGMILSSLILHGEHPWAEIYDPERLRLRSTPELLETGLHLTRKYAEWLTGSESEASSVAAVSRGTGRVIRRAGRPVAVYRDQEGVLHERSAACTHLGCIVHWNAAEASWDCPCHGSRFSPTGEPIHGPASKPLSRPEV